MLALYFPEYIVLDASVSLDGKLMVSATASLLKAESFWTTMPISNSATGSVDTTGGACWPDWSFCAVFRDGCVESPVRPDAGSGFSASATVFPWLTSLSGFDDGSEVDLVLLLSASDMAENDILMSSSVVPVSAMFFIRPVIV